MNTLGERIAYYRKAVSLTQEQLAEKCHVSPQAVSKWENDLSAPDISLLAPLAELFGVSVDELLGREPRGVRAEDPQSQDMARRIIHIRCIEGGDKVNLNLPLSVVESLLQGGAAIGGEALQHIDFAGLVEMVRAGTVGKLIEAESEGGGRVEVWVD